MGVSCEDAKLRAGNRLEIEPETTHAKRTPWGNGREILKIARHLVNTDISAKVAVPGGVGGDGETTNPTPRSQHGDCGYYMSRKYIVIGSWLRSE